MKYECKQNLHLWYAKLYSNFHLYHRQVCFMFMAIVRGREVYRDTIYIYSTYLYSIHIVNIYYPLTSMS